MLILTLAVVATVAPPKLVPRPHTTATRVSARLVRGGEGSKQAHGSRRTHSITEQLSDGRKISVIVFDYE